jgi:hypothetical protein
MADLSPSGSVDEVAGEEGGGGGIGGFGEDARGWS